MIGGGIHPVSFKQVSRYRPIQNFSSPEKVILPLSQHTGAPAIPVVKKGEPVKKGQMIAQANGFVSSPVHASIAGKVSAVEYCYLPSGRRSLAIVMENDGSQAEIESTETDWHNLSPETIIDCVRQAGIVGMGGAAFPTHVKLTVPEAREAKLVILNGCECEPFLTCDEQVFREETSAVIEGLQIICQATGAEEACVAIEGEKGDLAQIIRNHLSGLPVKLKILPEKYPQGSEKQLIEALTGLQVPCGKLPIDVGCLVFNVQTALAVQKAVKKGWPLVERVLTVSGVVEQPVNLRVPIGTTVADILKFCGISLKEHQRVIMGGPMMGQVLPELNIPVLKGTSGLVIWNQGGKFSEEAACIRCGRCLQACPMKLAPAEIGRQARLENWEACQKLHVNDCLECGCCAYVCPSRLPLVAWFKWAKAELRKAFAGEKK